MKRLITIVAVLIVGMSISAFAGTSIEERVSQNTELTLKLSEAHSAEIDGINKMIYELYDSITRDRKRDSEFVEKFRAIRAKQIDVLTGAITALEERSKLLLKATIELQEKVKRLETKQEE